LAQYRQIESDRTDKGRIIEVNEVKKTKWSPILHGVAAIAGTAGILAVFAAWIAGNATYLGISQANYFENAKVLLLVSVAFGIGTLIHLHGEKKK